MSKYNEGEQFEDETGKFVIKKVPDDDLFDYYVDYSIEDRRNPDWIGKREDELDSAERVD